MFLMSYNININKESEFFMLITIVINWIQILFGIITYLNDLFWPCTVWFCWNLDRPFPIGQRRKSFSSKNRINNGFTFKSLPFLLDTRNTIKHSYKIADLLSFIILTLLYSFNLQFTIVTLDSSDRCCRPM